MKKRPVNRIVGSLVIVFVQIESVEILFKLHTLHSTKEEDFPLFQESNIYGSRDFLRFDSRSVKLNEELRFSFIRSAFC